MILQKERAHWMRVWLIGAMILATTAAHAAKANGLPATVRQADGSQITVVLHGDEHEHYVTTTDGVLLASHAGGYYIAQVDAEGRLSPTPLLAHNAGQRTRQELQAIAAQPRQAFHQARQERAARRAEAVSPNVKNYFPREGTPRAVVILAQFSDLSFKHDSITTHQIFDQLLNAEGQPVCEAEPTVALNYGSVRQYFSDMSYGRFVPQFDVFGPVTLPETMAAYGKNENVTKLMKDACSLVDEEIDFAAYDANDDGEVDLVYVIYAGYGECYSGNPKDCLWPKSGTVSGDTYDGKQVVRYGIHCEMGGAVGSSDKINGIGLFCHEFSHTMGLPDLYTNASDADNMGMEDWDLMDGGEYLGDNIGTVPPEYSAWEREVMGWREMETLTEAGRYDLLTLDSDEGRGYHIDFDGQEREYIYLQNIQLRGWNKRARGHGMLAVHVRYNTPYVMTGDHPNASASSLKRVTLIPADGELYSLARLSKNPTDENQKAYLSSYRSDPFPGTLGVDSLTDNGDVYPELFDGSARLGKPLLDITERSGIVSFTFLHEVIPTSIDNIERSPIEHSTFNILSPIYDLQGRRVGSMVNDQRSMVNDQRSMDNDQRSMVNDQRSMVNGQLRKGIYLSGGRKFVIDK